MNSRGGRWRPASSSSSIECVMPSSLSSAASVSSSSAARSVCAAMRLASGRSRVSGLQPGSGGGALGPGTGSMSSSR